MKDLEDDEREFPIRVYTKVELARFMHPICLKSPALNNLSRWSRHNKLLMARSRRWDTINTAIHLRPRKFV